jgi:hypothetical protein
MLLLHRLYAHTAQTKALCTLCRSTTTHRSCSSNTGRAFARHPSLLLLSPLLLPLPRQLCSCCIPLLLQN